MSTLAPLDARRRRIATRLVLVVITLLPWAIEWIAEAVGGGERVRRRGDVTGQVGCIAGRPRSGCAVPRC